MLHRSVSDLSCDWSPCFRTPPDHPRCLGPVCLDHRERPSPTLHDDPEAHTLLCCPSPRARLSLRPMMDIHLPGFVCIRHRNMTAEPHQPRQSLRFQDLGAETTAVYRTDSLQSIEVVVRTLGTHFAYMLNTYYIPFAHVGHTHQTRGSSLPNSAVGDGGGWGVVVMEVEVGV